MSNEKQKFEEQEIEMELIEEPDQTLSEQDLEEPILEMGDDTRKNKQQRTEKEKPKITYEPVHSEKCIRKKLVNGKFHSYEATYTYKRIEVYDEKKKRMVKKQKQQRKTFYSLDDAILWRNEMQADKIEANRKKQDFLKNGVRVVDAVDTFYKEMQGQVSKGKVSESYLQQMRIQGDHFKKFFTGERTTYVRDVDVKQIEDYFLFEEDAGRSRASIAKYKSHLKAIWDFMLKDRVLYGVSENVVERARITTPRSGYSATALNYKQINELISEACKLEDPTFLYLVVMSMTQGLRRGELAGLQWGDIDFTIGEVDICHNRVQLGTKETLKKPKREKVRKIELHKAGMAVICLYKQWQESMLGREVRPDEFVLQWEINLLQDYICLTGKISRRWKEIYGQINKQRQENKKEPIPYGRIHDGRHTYITLSIQGIKKDDDTIIEPASYFQVFQSAGHSLPRSMQNTSTTVYNEDVGDRWDITRFWNQAITVDVAKEWEQAVRKRTEEFEALSKYEQNRIKARHQRRLEKAREERLKSNPLVDVLVEYDK